MQRCKAQFSAPYLRPVIVLQLNSGDVAGFLPVSSPCPGAGVATGAVVGTLRSVHRLIFILSLLCPHTVALFCSRRLRVALFCSGRLRAVGPSGLSRSKHSFGSLPPALGTVTRRYQ